MRSVVLPLFAAVFVASASAQQTPTAFPAPSEVLTGLRLRAGTVQDLSLPITSAGAFDVTVVVDGAPRTLALLPHDVRAPGFRLLADDGTSLRQIPTPACVTYRGHVRGLAGSDVAASLIEGQLTATIHLADGTQWAVQPMSTVNSALPRAWHAVYRGSDVIAPAARCGVDFHAHKAGHQHGGGAPAALKICEIAIDADLAYFTRFGSNMTAVNNQITSIINSNGVIYRRDVEIDYTITTIIVRTTALYTWNGTLNDLLTQFRNHWNANHGGITRDVAHLFTGEGMFTGTIGLAFVGAICTDFGYGVSMAYDTNLATNVALVAHEIGHNWNAGHCDAAPPCNIMCSGIGGCSGNITSFDPGSVTTIVAFKNTRTCLSDPGTGQWAEVADAGAVPSAAQAPLGTGALGSIAGTVVASGDLDMYLIRIVNEGSFSATTVGAGPTLGDTQLFLLDASGHGVVCNDDAGGGTRSTIDSTLVTANGLYFLAVSGYDRDITNNGALVFANTTTGQVGPNAGAGPANGTTTAASPTGTYTIVLTGCEFAPTSHAELGDAADLPHLAQAPCSVGPLTAIAGSLSANDVDLYRIQVDAPASFSASTCNGASYDTQLFLFAADGRGVVCNDDVCGAQSTLTNAMVTAPGVYYLAISHYDRDPDSLLGRIFPNTTTGQIGPTGPGGALPLAGWSGNTAAGGAYTIALTGCAHASAAVALDYGTGAGSAPGVPTLTTTFPPQLGNSTGLTLSNPDATAAGMALVLGQSRTAIPFLNGTLYVGNMITVLGLPAPMVGANTIGPFRLSRQASLCGSAVTWQVVVVVVPTAGFPTGLTWTNGTEWTFGI
jgi:hypothetical protein